MLTLDVMNNIRLSPVPHVQKAVGWVVRGNYRDPRTRTRTTIKNPEYLPERPAYLAMNHTDRYNYWPLQIHMWRKRNEFMAIWVKGKYYNHPAMRKFLIATNQIPAPSRGYLITADVIQVLRSPPSAELYRLIRSATNEGWEDTALLKTAAETGLEREVKHLIKTPRNLLGLEYSPWKHSFVERHREWFRQMMDRFIELNLEAFDVGLRVLVFPEGTRSLLLGSGKPGLAQMALRTRTAIVPIGCNGCDEAYATDLPWSRGGNIEYRIGKPLTPEGELAPFQVEDDFRPFTNEATAYQAQIDGTTDLVMAKIAGLLDKRYLSGPSTAVEGASRFV